MISPESRRLLVHLAACEWDKPLPRVDVDWDQLFQAIRAHRITGLAYYYLARHEGDYPPAAFRRAIKLLHYQNARRMVDQYRDYKVITGHLLSQGIDFMAVKGPVLAHTVYPSPAIRYIRDADILIREQDRAAVHRALEEIGYKVGEGHVNYLPPLVPEVLPLRHTQYFKANGVLPVEIHYDNFLLDDLVLRDLESIRKRAVEVDIDGVIVKVPAPEDHFLHLCAHAHQHRFSLLFWLSDLLIILRRYEKNFNWDLFLRTVIVEEAKVPVYYAMSLLIGVFGQSIPIDVMHAVRPDRLRRWVHERYVSQEDALVLSGEDRPPLSFKSTPFFSSTMLNILVMSRRAEKIWFLFRLLIPTKEWIRHRYNLSTNESVLPFYFKRLFLHSR